MNLYLTDHGVYPDWQIVSARQVFGLAQYSPSLGTPLVCPSDSFNVRKLKQTEEQIVSRKFAESLGHYFWGVGYGYNIWGTGGSGPGGIPSLGLTHGAHPDDTKAIPDSQVKVPGDMIAFGDAFLNPFSLDHGALLVLSLKPPGGIGLSKRHIGGANMVFCDAHVEFAKRAKWAAFSDEPRKRWNSDNQPHRETWNWIDTDVPGEQERR